MLTRRLRRDRVLAPPDGACPAWAANGSTTIHAGLPDMGLIPLHEALRCGSDVAAADGHPPRPRRLYDEGGGG